MEFERREPDEILHNIKEKFNLHRPKSSPFIIIAIIILLLLIKGVFYTIQPNEVGVVLRFGKFVRTTQPGLHFKLPLGIEKAIPVKVEYVYKDEFGFRTQSASVRTRYSSQSYAGESLMLSGDLNVVNLEWIVQFKIKDPYKALFEIRNVSKTLRDISESVMRKIVGDYTFNEILTVKRIEINNKAQENMQEILDFYNTGLHIVTVKLQDVNPPDTVKSAFNEVNQAKQEKEKLINEAWQVYNQKIPQAKGEALKMVEEAKGYALEKVNNAQGDTKRFDLLRTEYARAKDVTKKRLYLDAMNDILKKTGQKYIVDSEEKGILPLLKLENE